MALNTINPNQIILIYTFILMKWFVLTLSVAERIALKGKYFPLYLHFLDETYLLASLCVAIELILCTVDWLKVRESIRKLHPITRLQNVCLTVGSMSKLVIQNIMFKCCSLMY
jgi:hypothetical protein